MTLRDDCIFVVVLVNLQKQKKESTRNNTHRHHCTVNNIYSTFVTIIIINLIYTINTVRIHMCKTLLHLRVPIYLII